MTIYDPLKSIYPALFSLDCVNLPGVNRYQKSCLGLLTGLLQIFAGKFISYIQNSKLLIWNRKDKFFKHVILGLPESLILKVFSFLWSSRFTLAKLHLITTTTNFRIKDLSTLSAQIFTQDRDLLYSVILLRSKKPGIWGTPWFC